MTKISQSPDSPEDDGITLYPESMNNTTGTAATSQNDSGASWDISSHLYYVIAGAVALGVVVVVMVVIVVWRRKRRNREDAEAGQDKGDRIYDEISEERGGDGEKRAKKATWKNSTTKKPDNNNDLDNNDNNNGNTTNTNTSGGIELVAMDTAPDIITAHDNESIYETLDGRRAALAARARAKAAGHATTAGHHQSEDFHHDVGGMDCGGVPTRFPFPSSSTSPTSPAAAGGQEGYEDSTYDHLHRYSRPLRFPPRLPPSLPEKRYTDSEVTTRDRGPKPKDREVHSADFATIHSGLNGVKNEDAPILDQSAATEWLRASRRGAGGGAGGGESPSGGSLRSSLTEAARQSACGGRRLVCQLTMVGVVENGKPVPVKPAAATNTYFILEPAADSQGKEEEQQDQERAPGQGGFSPPTPRFRIKSEPALKEGEEGTGGREGGGGGVVVAPGVGDSNYFILEPLEQQGDLQDLTDMRDLPTPLPPLPQSTTELPPDYGRCQAALSRPPHPHPHTHTGQGLLHHHHPQLAHQHASAARSQARAQSFRQSRISSCPERSPSTERDSEDSPTRLPSHSGYARSMSSPQRQRRSGGGGGGREGGGGAERRKEELSSPTRKMDADVLKARIRREMIALGFLHDSEVQSDAAGTNNEETLSSLSNNPRQDSQPPFFSCTERSAAGNSNNSNYFILEPQHDDPDEDTELGNMTAEKEPAIAQQQPDGPEERSFGGGGFNGGGGGEEPARYQHHHHQQATSPTTSSPPPLPSRNRHGRSKSETPPLARGRSADQGEREQGQSPNPTKDQGPVVVSLSKLAKQRSRNRDRDRDREVCVPSEEGFRPRFKSESGVLSERFKRRRENHLHHHRC